jgi:hypothetical protein
MSRYADRTDDDTIRQRSGWLIPLGVFLVTAILTALILLFYIIPSPPSLFEEQVNPTGRTDIIHLKVHGNSFYIPANYLEYKSARQGGEKKEIALFAMMPDMDGYSSWEAGTFTGNATDSPIVYLLIDDEPVNLTEADRLQRIYMAYVANPKGTQGPFGLTQYMFHDDTGYRREDLFVGTTDAGPVVLRCVRFSQEVPSPSCLREMPIAHGVKLSYRFKRAQLARWREISDGVNRLIKSFGKAPTK